MALELARRLNADVVSADSRQIYKHLLIGTSKPAGQWKEDATHPLKRYYAVENIPHHLMDFLEPTGPYNAGLFAKQAGQLLETLLAAQRPVILAGGTGLYLKALVDGLAELPPKDDSLRKQLAERAAREGRKVLHENLVKLDPESAARIPPNNLVRVIRALEVFELTGKPLSWWQKEKTTPSARPFRWFGLRWPKERMEKHLAERCRRMSDGLIEETRRLLDQGVPATAPAFESLGYRTAVDLLAGKLSLAEFEKDFFLQTRQYVKRQMTWFRANIRIHWLDVGEPFDAGKLAEEILSG